MSDSPRSYLSDIVEKKTEKYSGPKDPETPYVGVEHLAEGQPQVLGSEPSTVSKGTNAVFEPGDILFSKLRPYLRKCAQVGFQGLCSTELYVLTPSRGVDPDFAAYQCCSETIFQEAIRTSKGTRMPRTSWQDLRGTELFVPSLPEQRRIAHVLDTADAAIRRSEAVIDKLEHVKQGLLHDLLTRGLNEEGRLRPPLEEAPDYYVEGELGSLPKSWEERKLGALITKGPRNGLYKPKSAYHPDGVPIIRISGFRGEKRFDLGRLERVRVTNEELATYGLDVGDILINRVNSIEYVGLSAAVPNLGQPTVYESNFMRCRVDGKVVRPRFVGEFLQSHRAQIYFKRTARPAVHQASVNQDDVAACPIPVPSIEEQDAILEIRDRIEERLREERRIVGKLRDVQRGLMQDLLTSRVRVPASIEVPA